MLYYPYRYDLVHIDPGPRHLRFNLGMACRAANGGSNLRTVKPLSWAGVLRTASGHRDAKGSGGNPLSTISVVGLAWMTDVNGRCHVRVLGGRVYPRANVWGMLPRSAPEPRPEELVYPDLLERIAALWGHDEVVPGLLRQASTGAAGEKAACYLVLADRLEELDAIEDADLLRQGRWKGKKAHVSPPPAPKRGS
jgi:hypothetical protein